MTDSKYEKRNLEPRTKTNKKKGLIIFGIIIGVVILVAILASIFGGRSSKEPGVHDKPFSSGKQNVAQIHITGEITEEGTEYNQEWLTNTINTAKFDKDNKGIMLVINSPGGTIYESDETYQRLMDYKEETGRPIYAYMEHMAASGGYYVATPADQIYINRNGITGSIGVIGGAAIDASELMEKIGVKAQVIHSGANKVMGSLYEPMTEEQIAILQALSDEAYAQFVEIVAQGRNMDPARVRELADGRIYTAKQAVENGLVDGMSEYQDFEDKMVADQGFEDKVEFVEREYEQEKTLFDNMIGLRGEEFIKGMPQDPLTSTLETLRELEITEPMYLYQR